MIVSRIQGLVKHSVVYTLPGIAGQFIHVLLVPVYTRIFVPAQYGIMAGVNLAVPLATFLLMFAMESAIIRFYYEGQDDREKKLIVSTGLYFVAILSVLVIAIAVIFFPSDISHLVLGSGEYSLYFVVALAAIPFGLCYKLALDILRLKFEATRRTVISMTQMLVNIGLTIYFVVFLRIGIVGVFLSTLITNVVFMSVVLLLVRANYTLAFSATKLKKMLRFCAPLVPATMAFYVFQYADRYLLIHLTNLEEVGLYSIGLAIASALFLLVSGFQTAWMPTVYSSYREGEAREFYARIFNYFWALLLAAAVGVSLFGKEILTVLAPQTYLRAYSVVPILVLSAVFFRGGPLFSFGIGIAKKTHYNLALMAGAVALNIGLNLLFIPRYAMVGAAMATLISAIARAVGLFVLSQRLYRVEYDLLSFFKILALAVAIISAGYFLFSDISLPNILIKVGLLGAYLGALFLFHLIGKKELNYLRRLAYNKRRQR